MGNNACCTNGGREANTSIIMEEGDVEEYKINQITQEQIILKAMKDGEHEIEIKKEKSLQERHGPDLSKGKLFKSKIEVDLALRSIPKPKEVQQKKEELEKQDLQFVYKKMMEDHNIKFQGSAYIDGFQFNSNKSIYVGYWSKQKREGYGKLYYPDGSYYEGFWNNDMANGYGWMIHFDGSIYMGEWKDDKMHGEGTYTQFQTGTQYNGYWEDDKQQGQGKEVHYDKQNKLVSEFEGQFQQGQKYGFGKMFWIIECTSYEGDFKNNLIDGFGTYKWSDGRQYTGQWTKGKMNGKGIFRWRDRTYDGLYVDDKKQGQGAFYWKDGRKYRGDFHNGKIHGVGYFSKIQGQKSESLTTLKYKTLQQQQQPTPQSQQSFSQLNQPESRYNSIIMAKTLNSNQEPKDYLDTDEQKKQRVERRGLWEAGKFVKWLEGEEEYLDKLKNNAEYQSQIQQQLQVQVES